jgi:hypothetical protein
MAGGAGVLSRAPPVRRIVGASAYVHVHVVLSAIVDEWDVLVGALLAVEDNACYTHAAVVADGDVMECLAVAIVDLE